jgi:hypothetical protein
MYQEAVASEMFSFSHHSSSPFIRSHFYFGFIGGGLFVNNHFDVRWRIDED